MQIFNAQVKKCLLNVNTGRGIGFSEILTTNLEESTCRKIVSLITLRQFYLTFLKGVVFPQFKISPVMCYERSLFLKINKLIHFFENLCPLL